MPLAGVANLKVSKCAASSRGTFKSKPLERSCARRFGVEENFSQAFFCHCLGRGKFQAKLFFAMVSGNAAGVGDVGGARCPPRLCGDFDRRQEATERQRAMRVRGSAQGREISLTRFVFFGCFQVRSNNRLYLPTSDARRQLSPGEGAAVCRIASPTAMAAAIATLSERNPSRIGMTSRALAAACTFSGTPDVSRPNSNTSPRRNACHRLGWCPPVG